MNAYELFGIELRFEAADCLSQQMRLLATVNRHVVTFRLNPVDLIRLEKVNAPARLDNKPFEKSISRF
jgi:hypothetical protein